jgi:hypothetical protein
MKTQFIAILAATTCLTTPTIAQQFNGASISGGFQSVDGDNGKLDVTSFSGGLEFGITPKFAIGANIETIRSDDFDDDVFVGTVRGIYNGSPEFGLGVYYSVERFDDFESELYGIEAAYSGPGSSFTMYYGGVDSDAFGGRDVTSSGGFDFDFGVGSGVSLGLDFQSYRVEDFLFIIGTGAIEDARITDTALSVSYDFAEGASVYAKAGRIRAFGSDREAQTRFVGLDSSEYLTIGAEYKFGGGTQFEARALTSFGG